MNQALKKAAETSVVLKKISTEYGGLSLRYSLAAVQSNTAVRYDVTAELGGKKQTVTLGTDIDKAFAIFQQLWKGAVTPCVLKETVSDIHMSAFLCEKSV